MKIKNIFFIYIFFLSIVTQQLHGMHGNNAQDKNKGQKVIVVPDITDPRGVVFCGNKRVAIIEPNTFTIVNTKIQKPVIKKDQTKMFDLAASKDSKVTLFREYSLAVYNGNTGEQEWQQDIADDRFFPIAFNSQDSSQVFLYKQSKDRLVIYSKNSQETREMMAVTSLDANCLFAQHPKKTKFIHGIFKEGAYCFTDHKDTIFGMAVHGMLRYQERFIIGQEYSYDGAYFAAVARGSCKTAIIFIPDAEEDRQYAKCIEPQKIIVSLAFHPNNRIIFLLDKNNSIECWDFHCQQLIKNINLRNIEPIIELPTTLEKRLTVSPNGKKLCVALKNTCLIMDIPFDVLYRLEFKEELFFMMSLLQLYAVDSSLVSETMNLPMLPKEVRYFIMKKIMKISRCSSVS